MALGGWSWLPSTRRPGCWTSARLLAKTVSAWTLLTFLPSRSWPGEVSRPTMILLVMTPVRHACDSSFAMHEEGQRREAHHSECIGTASWPCADFQTALGKVHKLCTGVQSSAGSDKFAQRMVLYLAYHALHNPFLSSAEPSFQFCVLRKSGLGRWALEDRKASTSCAAQFDSFQCSAEPFYQFSVVLTSLCLGAGRYRSG